MSSELDCSGSEFKMMFSGTASAGVFVEATESNAVGSESPFNLNTGETERYSRLAISSLPHLVSFNRPNRPFAFATNLLNHPTALVFLSSPPLAEAWSASHRISLPDWLRLEAIASSDSCVKFCGTGSPFASEPTNCPTGQMRTSGIAPLAPSSTIIFSSNISVNPLKRV